MEEKYAKASIRPIANIAFAFVVILASGCVQQLNDPWKDSSAVIDQDMKTPSSVAYQGPSEFGHAHKRLSWSAATVHYENGSVTHWPLWFEDPFEDRGNTDVAMSDPAAERDLPDNVFAWNWVDYFHLGYGPARELVNIGGWPISAVVTPPGTLMESDGRISKGLVWYDHDAKRSDPNHREPPDMNDVNKPQGSETSMSATSAATDAAAPTSNAPASDAPASPVQQ